MPLVGSMSTRQEVWQAAKESELDEFIGKVAAAFPDAIESVIIINSGGRYEYRRNDAGRQPSED